MPNVFQATAPRPPASLTTIRTPAYGGNGLFGPVNPTCLQTGGRYVLIVIDYFSRFVWAAPTLAADSASVIRIFEMNIAPVFGWPCNCFSDNRAHFTSAALRQVFDKHSVNHVFAPVSHPTSVGMVKRAVQMVLALVRRAVSSDRNRALEWGSSSWTDCLHSIAGLSRYMVTPCQDSVRLQPPSQTLLT